MVRFRAMLRSVLAAAALVWLAAVPVAAQIVDVPTGDPVMDKAIKKARDALPAFWARVAKPATGDSGFAVKLAYPKRGTGHEHIWANNVVKAGDSVTATINNDPRDIPDLKNGQKVTVPITMISDWMFYRDGKMHGAQTVRAVLTRLPKAQADDLRARLAPE